MTRWAVFFLAGAAISALVAMPQNTVVALLESAVCLVNDGSILGLPIWDVIVAISSALKTRESGAEFSLASLFACVVGGLGGGTIACALVGLPPTWMRNAVLLPVYVGAGALVLVTPKLAAPRNVVAAGCLDALKSLWTILEDTTFMCAVIWGAGLPAASPAIPTPPSIIAVAVAGLAASCGGGILCDSLSLRGEGSWGLRKPMALTAPTLYHICAPVLAVTSTALLQGGFALPRVRLLVTAAILAVTRCRAAWSALRSSAVAKSARNVE
jgi:uncharacterized membrane protein YeiH